LRKNNERYFRKLVHLHRHDPDLGYSCQWGLLAHQDIDRWLRWTKNKKML